MKSGISFLVQLASKQTNLSCCFVLFFLGESMCRHCEVWKVKQVAAAVPETPVELTLGGRGRDHQRWDLSQCTPHMGVGSSRDWPSPAGGHTGGVDTWLQAVWTSVFTAARLPPRKRPQVRIGGGQNEHLSRVHFCWIPRFLTKALKPAAVSITRHCCVFNTRDAHK